MFSSSRRSSCLARVGFLGLVGVARFPLCGQLTQTALGGFGR